VTPLVIEPATFRLAVQCLNQLPSINKPGGYSPACHSGNPGLFVFVGLWVEKVALGHGSLQVLMASLARFILIVHLSSGAQELYQKKCSSKRPPEKKGMK